MTLDEFFAEYEDSRQIFEALREAIEELGPAEIRVTKSQVAFCREKAFAWAWVPDRYLHGKHAPLVLTLGLRHRDRDDVHYVFHVCVAREHVERFAQPDQQRADGRGAPQAFQQLVGDVA